MAIFHPSSIPLAILSFLLLSNIAYAAQTFLVSGFHDSCNDSPETESTTLTATKWVTSGTTAGPFAWVTDTADYGCLYVVVEATVTAIGTVPPDPFLITSSGELGGAQAITAIGLDPIQESGQLLSSSSGLGVLSVKPDSTSTYTYHATSTITLTSYVSSSSLPLYGVEPTDEGSTITMVATYPPYTSVAPPPGYIEETTTVSVVRTTTASVSVQVTSVVTVVQTTTVRADAGTFSRADIALMGMALGAVVYGI